MTGAWIRFTIAATLVLAACSTDSNSHIDRGDSALPDAGNVDASRSDAGDDDGGGEIGDEDYLSDWVWLYENVGTGGPAERDKSINGPPHGDGSAIRLRGTRYDKGIGVSGPSELRFNLDARCSRFRSILGVDDESLPGTEAQAEVWADGVRIFRSGSLTRTSEPEHIDVDVTDAYELSLVVYGQDDHVDWANARVVCEEEDWHGDAVASHASDWLWDAMSNGLGPVERDRNNGEEAEEDGTAIRLQGRSYGKGIGVHAPAEVEFSLSGHCRRFLSKIGVDDAVTTGGSVVFQVWVDDVMRYQSNTMTSESATGEANVDLVGSSTLRLVVTDAGDGSASDLADWADARLLCRSGWEGQRVDTHVSDWVLALAKNGYGPVERNRTNGNLFAHDGRPIVMDGETYSNGLGTHANAEIRLTLGGRCTRFRAAVGIDDDSASGGAGAGSVTFHVSGAGAPIFTSPVKHFGDAPTPIDVDVTGRPNIVLIADGGEDDSSWDHADWGDARLSCEVGALGL